MTSRLCVLSNDSGGYGHARKSKHRVRVGTLSHMIHALPLGIEVGLKIEFEYIDISSVVLCNETHIKHGHCDSSELPQLAGPCLLSQAHVVPQSLW